MNYKIVESGDAKYIELISCTALIGAKQDAMDLIALCGQNDTDHLMIHSEAISDDFFRLKTGVAGKILQKFINYHISAVAIVPDERVNTGKFKDMAIEANRGSYFRIFAEKSEAEKWLLGK